jgi:5'-methylthioadenosine phosphorylase
MYSPMSRSRPLLGVLGGSGLYRLDGLEAVEPIELDTPFGVPSAAYRRGRARDADIVFLPRHGDGHRLLPSEINHQANIHGFLQLGVRQVLSFTAVGSLREDIRPRDIVLPDQYVDRTKQNHTFFGDGVAAHVPFGDPVCPALHRIAAHLATERLPGPARVHQGGTYVNIEGPAFSTRAESQMYRTLGFDIVGMTSLPEAKLAREAGLCYAAVALVTDYDCWRAAEESPAGAPATSRGQARTGPRAARFRWIPSRPVRGAAPGNGTKKDVERGPREPRTALNPLSFSHRGFRAGPSARGASGPPLHPRLVAVGPPGLAGNSRHRN